MFKYILILVLIFFSIPCLYAGDLFYNFSFELKLFNKKMPLFKNLPSSMKDIQLIKNKARFEKNFNSNSKDTAFIIEMVNSFIKLHFLEIKFSIEEMKKVRKIILEHVKDVDLKNPIQQFKHKNELNLTLKVSEKKDVFGKTKKEMLLSVHEQIGLVKHSNGSIDIIVNCAGSLKVGLTNEITSNDFQNILQINHSLPLIL